MSLENPQMMPYLEMDSQEIEKRFDLHMIKAYLTHEDIRQVWNDAAENWRSDEKIADLSLSCFLGNDLVTPEEDDEAMRNIADFYLEPYFVSTMSIGQASGYYSAIEKRMPFHIEGPDPDTNKPLILESIHHHCTFSLIYLALKYLITHHEYNKVIMLHHQEPADARLVAAQNCVITMLGAEGILQTFQDDWLRTLKRTVTDRTIVIYMGDMPPSIFPGQHKPKETSSILRMGLSCEKEILLEGFSIARKLVRLCKADHFLLDVPEKNQLRFRKRHENTELFCPLSAWVYWPAAKKLFKEIDASILKSPIDTSQKNYPTANPA